jgi:hypothetical protein
VVAYLALFFALGGVAGAAAQPLLDKPGSVESSHIESGAVKGSDIAPEAVGMKKLAPKVRGAVDFELPESGPYLGQSEDGSVTVTAIVAAGQILELAVSGADCTWNQPSGHFDAVGGSQWTWASNGPGDAVLAITGDFQDEVALRIDELGIIGGPNSGSCAAPILLTLQKSPG